jgi:hypothetical protein
VFLFCQKSQLVGQPFGGIGTFGGVPRLFAAALAPS